MRTPLLAALLVLVLVQAGPAAAHDPPAQGGIGEPAAAAVAPVREDGTRVGELLVERDGDDIVATVSFRGRPPTRKVTLCVSVAGKERCVRRRPGDDGLVRLERKGDFVAALKARTAFGGARGSLRM